MIRLNYTGAEKMVKYEMLTHRHVGEDCDLRAKLVKGISRIQTFSNSEINLTPQKHY